MFSSSSAQINQIQYSLDKKSFKHIQEMSTMYNDDDDGSSILSHYEYSDDEMYTTNVDKANQAGNPDSDGEQPAAMPKRIRNFIKFDHDL